MMKSSTKNRNKCKKVKLRKWEAKLRIAVVSGDLKILLNSRDFSREMKAINNN